MKSHASTRRNAICAVILIWLLVCGGLGWATWAAVELERHRVRDNEALKRTSNDKSLALARGHLDSITETLLSRERDRRFLEFRAFYIDATYGSPLLADPELRYVQSPLRTMELPDWLIVHFQVSWTHGMSSPQVDPADDVATPASAIPASERPEQATAANWLAALRERYEPLDLQQRYEEAQRAKIDQREAILGIDDAARAFNDRTSDSSHAADLPAVSKTAAEFALRGQRLLDLQRQYFPEDQCVSEPVVIENLQFGGDLPPPSAVTGECVPVTVLPMLPVWLDLTMDGERQMALIRSVSVEGYTFCTMQGVLINWSRFCGFLEDELQGLPAGTRIEPVDVGTRWQEDMLRYLPTRLVSQSPRIIAVGTTRPGFKWGLILTWGVTLLALFAITYGLMKYVGMSERRMRFAAAVTHELRTPLTSFQLYTDLLATMGAKDEAARSQYIDTLRKESRRLARLVENVLAYSKISESRAMLRADDLTPQQVLSDVVAETAKQCDASGKKLVIENECAQGTSISSDREFVLQILANIVENACKYSADAEDPSIWLTAHAVPGEGVVFEVEDCGKGVAPADRKAVFEPFQRSSTTAGANASGLGLGLALSRHWASCLGGRLVLSRGRRNGAHYSRFSLSLPAN